MDNAGFSPTNWSHWLLVGGFVAVSVWGLVLSWRWGEKVRARRKWNRRVRAERRRVELARRVAMDLEGRRYSSPKVLQLSRGETAQWQDNFNRLKH